MLNLQNKMGTGLNPEQFIDSMTVNREKFEDVLNRFEWASEDREAFSSLQEQKKLHCFILAADWCGDVIRNVPVVFRIMADAQIPVEVLIMEKNPEVMDEFLTMGGRSIPIVIFTNQEGNVLGKWGPRPSYVQEPMVQFKQKYPTKDGVQDYEEKIVEVYKEITKRYGQGTEYHRLIVQELRELLTSI